MLPHWPQKPLHTHCQGETLVSPVARSSEMSEYLITQQCSHNTQQCRWPTCMGQHFYTYTYKNMHPTWTDRHMPGVCTHTEVYKHTAIHPISWSSPSQTSHYSALGLLPVLWQFLTWDHFTFCSPVSMHGRSLQESSCTTAELHLPQVLVLASSWMWLSAEKGTSRAIVSAFHLADLQQSLVQGLLDSDMGCTTP